MQPCTVALRVIAALGASWSAVCAAQSAIVAPAADIAPRPAASAAEQLIAINTVCPVDGERIDPQIAPIRARTVTGRVIGIGVCSRTCAEIVRKDPDRFIEDAIANHRHRAASAERP